jgi:hypothetical protein
MGGVGFVTYGGDVKNRNRLLGRFRHRWKVKLKWISKRKEVDMLDKIHMVEVQRNILLRKNHAVRYDKRREVNLVSEQFVIFQDGIFYFMKCVILKLQELYLRQTSLLK